MVREVFALALKALHVVWRRRIEFFWLNWTGVTVVAAVCAVWIVSRGTIPACANEVAVTDTDPSTRRSAWRNSLSVLVFLVLFLVSYIALLLKWEDFAYYDDSLLTSFSLRDIYFSPPIWQDGRFFPLGHQEFNLIRHFTKSVLGYHLLPILELMIGCYILLILDRQLSIKERAGFIVVLLLTPGFVLSFGGLIYPEYSVVFCLLCLLLFVEQFSSSHHWAWVVASVVSAQIMLYEKETVFLLLLGFVVGRLVWRCWDLEQGVWKFDHLKRKESLLDLCLASLTILFLLYYAAAMYPRPKVYYNADERLSLLATCVSYVQLDLLAWLLVIFAACRMIQILRRAIPPSPFWDGLAWGGMLCFASYLYLGMSSAYYLTPVNVIAVLYVGRFVILTWKWTAVGPRLAAAALLAAVLVQNVSLSAICLFQRKNVIHAKAAIARVVAEQYRLGRVQTLFFPFANPYALNEFASYLSYRGIPVEKEPLASIGRKPSHFVSRSVANDGPCVPRYLNFSCYAGNTPEAGDLVIVLPDDNASLIEVQSYRKSEELIFSYQPSPEIPAWLKPYIMRIPIAARVFYPFGVDLVGAWPHKTLPDRWMDASVAVWRGQKPATSAVATR